MTQGGALRPGCRKPLSKKCQRRHEFSDVDRSRRDADPEISRFQAQAIQQADTDASRQSKPLAHLPLDGSDLVKARPISNGPEMHAGFGKDAALNVQPEDRRTSRNGWHARRASGEPTRATVDEQRCLAPPDLCVVLHTPIAPVAPPLLP